VRARFIAARRAPRSPSSRSTARPSRGADRVELFGHEKDRSRRDPQTDRQVRGADGGTIFLDEIGDMSRHAGQSLRVLRKGSSRRSATVIKVDVRVIAARKDW